MAEGRCEKCEEAQKKIAELTSQLNMMKVMVEEYEKYHRFSTPAPRGEGDAIHHVRPGDLQFGVRMKK